jgi:kumamolisin
MAETNKIALPGSEKAAMPNATVVGPTAPSEIVEVSIVLKQRRALNLADLQGKHLSHDEFASAYGAEPEQLERVRAFARENNLEVVERDDEAARRTITVHGTVADLEKAFSVTLDTYAHTDGQYRGRTGAIHIPSELADIVQAVLGLDNRPQAKPHFRYRKMMGASEAAAQNISYSPVQVGELYGFPTDVNGAGQTIAILELGGGFHTADIVAYFKSLNLTPPTVNAVSIDHAKSTPTTADSADGEVFLDIEVAGAVAPGAKIAVYFAPNTSQGFQDAMSAAIHDKKRNPSVLSISWGGPESSWTAQSMQTMDQVAQEAAALGVTITVASGDDGSSDGSSDGSDQVDFPASSPHVLACGGTSLQSANGKITKETVWNDGASGGAGGGGFSTVFTRPSFQEGLPSTFASQTGRGVPDVSGDADPETGYMIRADGEDAVIGGTSAVAPLWAGLIALLNDKLKTRLGYVNPALYALNEGDGFNDITSGNNGTYSAGKGWDAATGLGSPKGSALASLLAGTQTKQGA